MKKILAIAAVAALTAGVSAYAANPFSDVTPNDWAYQAVSNLSDQGIVEGYPDGTFKGQQNMTRYELAQITARLLAKEDQYNAEQRATIDKLAAEYADELNSLGVRVDNLEKKVGNIRFYGDARMRYQDLGKDTDGKDIDKYTGRIRINARGQVNDNTYVHGRFSTGNVDLKDNGDSTVTMDRLYVHNDFSKYAGVTLGRYEVDMGGMAGWLYANAFDGAEVQFKATDKIGLSVGYGRFKDISDTTFGEAELDGTLKMSKEEAMYAQGKFDFGVANLAVDYYKYQAKVGDQVIGANVVVPINDFRVFGDYYVNTDASGDPTVWAAGVGYGKLDGTKPGSFAIDLGYYDAESGLYRKGMTGWQTDMFNGTLTDDVTFWYAMADVTLAKNVTLHGEYGFAADGDKFADPEDQYTVSLNYKF